MRELSKVNFDTEADQIKQALADFVSDLARSSEQHANNSKDLAKDTPLYGWHQGSADAYSRVHNDATELCERLDNFISAAKQAHKRLLGLQRSLDEALNSGSGVYRP